MNIGLALFLGLTIWAIVWFQNKENERNKK